MEKEKLLHRISDVIRTDATYASRADFLATHTPFRNMEYTYSGDLSAKTSQIDEETFFNKEVLAKRGKHNFIMIQGNNGSGKSHFIKWLKEKYINEIDEEKEGVLFISRDQSTLRGALEQIMNSGIFPPEFDKKEIEKIAKASQQLGDEGLKQNIVMNFATAAKMDKEKRVEEENISHGLKKRYKKIVYEFLVDPNIQNFLFREGGPVERIEARLNPDETQKRRDDIAPRFTPEDFNVNIELLNNMNKSGASRNAKRMAEDLKDKGQLREQLSNYLNEKLEYVVHNCTQLSPGDLKEIFEQLRVLLKEQGKDLTLFIEDITSFTGLDRAIVEVLITEHGGTEKREQFCRLFSVVGVTSDFYRTSVPDNIKDRVTCRVFMDNASLNNEDEIAEMAARYINAINLEEHVLNHWLDNGAREEELPIAEDNLVHSWALYNLPDRKEVSLFPFNKTSLEKMYNNLNHKTPRSFLNNVIRQGLQLYASKEQDGFPPPKDRFTGQFKMPEWIEPLHPQRVKREVGDYFGSIETLLLIWGEQTAFAKKVNGEVMVGGLKKEVFDSFGLPFIEGIPSVDKPKPPGPEPVTPDPPKPKTPKPKPDPSKEESEEEKKFRKVQEDLDIWQGQGRLNYYQQLRDDVCDLLVETIDWQSRGIPGFLVTAFLSRQRVSIEGQTGKIYPGFQVRRNDKSYYALLALAAWRYLGKKSWNFEKSAEHLVNLYNWVIGVEEEVLRSVEAPPHEDTAKWELAKWSLLAEVHVQALAGNLSLEKANVDDIYNQIFRESPQVEVQDYRSKEWKGLQNKLKRNQNLIDENHDMVLRYFNNIQGKVTQSTSVYFLDAAEIIKILEELEKQGWKEALNDIPSAEDNSKWYVPLRLLNYFKGDVEKAVQDEIKETEERLGELFSLLGDNPDQEKIEKTFQEIIDFLKLLLNSNENFRQEDFDPILSDSLSPEELEDIIEELIQFSQTDDYFHSLLGFSKHPLGKLSDYLELLRKANTLVDKKKEKYLNTLNDLKRETGDVNDVIQQTKDRLEDMKKNLNGVF